MSNKGAAAEGHVRRLRFGEAEILGGIGVSCTRQDYVRKWVEAHWGGAGVQGAGVRNEGGENKVVRNKEVRNEGVRSKEVRNEEVRNKGVENKIVQSTGVRDGKVQNEEVQNKLVQNEKVQNKKVEDELVQNRLVQKEKVWSKEVQNELVHSTEVQNKKVCNKLVQDERVWNKLVQNEKVQNKEAQSKLVQNEKVQSKEAQNKIVQNEKVQSKEAQNKLIQNKLIQNKKVQSTEVQNKKVQSTEVQNKKVYNKLIQNTAVQNTAVQNTLVQSIEVENKNVQNKEVCNKEKQSGEAINTKPCNNLTGAHSEDEYIDNTQAECAPARVPARVRGLNCVNTRENMVVARSREACSLAVSKVGRDYKYQRAKENVPLLRGHSGHSNEPQEDSKNEKCTGALSPACKRSRAKRPNPDRSPVLSRGSCYYKQKLKRAKEERRESPGLLRSRSDISVRSEDSNKGKFNKQDSNKEEFIKQDSNKEEFNKQDSNEQDSKKMAARMDSNCSQKSADSDATHFSAAERRISVDSSEDLVKISEATSASVSGLRNESEFSISTATSPPRQNSSSLVEFKLLDSAKKKKKPKRGSLTEKLQSLVNNQASFVRIWRHQRKQSKDNPSPRAIALRVTAQGVHFTRQFFRGVVVSDPFHLLPSRTKDCGERESPSNVGRSITLMTVPEVIGSLEIKGRCLLQVAAPWDVLDDDDLVIVAAYVNAVPEEGINGGCVMFNRRETCTTNSVVDKEFNGGCTTFNRRETCTTNSVADKKINGGCIIFNRRERCTTNSVADKKINGGCTTFNGPPGSCTSSVVANEINGGCIKFTGPGSCKTNSAAGKQFNCDCIKFNRPLPSCKSAKEKPDVMEQLFRSV